MIAHFTGMVQALQVKGDGVNLVLWVNNSLFSEMTRLCKCFPRVRNISYYVSLRSEFLVVISGCDFRYVFHTKTMFGSSLPPVVLFMLFVVCLRIVVSNTYYVVFLVFFALCLM